MKVGTFDIETNGLFPELDRVWCAVVITHGSGEERHFTPEDVDQLCAYLETFDVLIGHHSIAFDFAALRKVYGWDYRGQKIDTLLMSRMQRPNRERPIGFKGKGPHSVEAWGHRLGQHKVEHEEWDRYSPEMLHRCAEDARIQVKIYEALLEEGAGEGWEKAHLLNHKLFHYLQMQEEYGWMVDQEWMHKCIETLTRWMDRIDRAISPMLPVIREIDEVKKDGEYGYVKKPFKKDGSLAAISERWLAQFDAASLELDEHSDNHSSAHTGGSIHPDVCGQFCRVSFRPVDLDSNKEVKQFLLDLGWEPKEWNTNNAGERTSPKLSKDDPFEGIDGKLGKLIVRRVQCKQRRGVIEGWVNLIRDDGRISAEVAGIATTARIRHKGIVNVPGSDAFFGKQMRRMFCTQPGWVLVGCDSAGNQVRQLAARMGDDDFTKSVLYGRSEDGTDLHSVNQRKAGLPTRTLAKNFFYGCIMFGAGDPKTAKICKTTVAKAKELKDNYFKKLPKLRQLIDKLEAYWQKTARHVFNAKWNRMEYRDGYIVGLDGRPILVESPHKILAFQMQSDEAIQMAAAYVWFHKQMEKRGYEWKKDYGTVIWMHDEYQVECRPEIAKEVGELMAESIAWAGRFFDIQVPHAGEYKIGKNWMETH